MQGSIKQEATERAERPGDLPRQERERERERGEDHSLMLIFADVR